MDLYRIVVGEVGNEIGHIVYTDARTLRGARRRLTIELNKYGGDGWGWIEYNRLDGADHGWGRLDLRAL